MVLSEAESKYKVSYPQAFRKVYESGAMPWLDYNENWINKHINAIQKNNWAFFSGLQFFPLPFEDIENAITAFDNSLENNYEYKYGSLRLNPCYRFFPFAKVARDFEIYYMFVADRENPKAEPFVAIYAVKDVVMYTCARNFRRFVFNLMIRYIKQQRKLREEINPEIINALTAFTGRKFDDIEINNNYDKMLEKHAETEQVFFPHLVPAEEIDSDIYAHNGNRENIVIDKKANSAIKIDEIRYIEAGNKSFSVHFKNKTETYNKYLSFIEDQLPQDRFYRCHKSYIAGFKHIANITEDKIIFDNGEKASLSRRKMTEFRKKFDEYKRSNLPSV
jgi:hypothetical protein